MSRLAKQGLAVVFVMMVVFWGACSSDSAPGKPPEARANLIDTQGKSVGKALLWPAPTGVRIVLEVEGLPAGVRAFHIHEVGKAEPPDFKSAGSHFNPFGKKHGMKNPEGHHAGDMPNIEIGPDGKGKVETLAPLVTLGPGENSLFHPGGTSLVIHALADDEKTDPTGNAGARIACGIIRKTTE